VVIKQTHGNRNQLHFASVLTTSHCTKKMDTMRDVFTVEFWVSHMQWIEVNESTVIVVLIALSVTVLVFLPFVLMIWCYIFSLVGCTKRIRMLRRDIKNGIRGQIRREDRVEVPMVSSHSQPNGDGESLLGGDYVLVDRGSDDS